MRLTSGLSRSTRPSEASKESESTPSKPKTAVLKSWVKESYQREVHENRKWEAKFFVPREVKTTKAHLNMEELKMLEAVKFPAKGKYGGTITAKPAVRDIFLLACWTAARISDAVRFPRDCRGGLEGEWQQVS